MVEEIQAAGGVVWRRRGGGDVEVLLVHRDRYDDWTFPKGKLDLGESWEQAAVREVHEETGVIAVLGAELASTRYRDGHGRAKRVRYWSMTVDHETGFEPNDEISALEWVALADAGRLLTYQRDRPVLESFVATSP